MIQDLNAVNVSGFKQIVDNVWRVTINGNRYAIKSRETNSSRTLIRSKCHIQWEMEQYGLGLRAVQQGHGGLQCSWSPHRALYRGEAAPMYIELPGASSLGSSDEWASRLFQIADWCDGVQSFMDAKQDAAMKKKLAKVLERKKPCKSWGRAWRSICSWQPRSI